ncbi:MAG TPA: DUF4845 domain-containing protein [Burkholderiaceae bacterium]|jgi:hypothetical protein|uniref:DUF4845 domain-containing protein n=1 Tax=Candidatus Skiveiella danica TaxID=3386177 RepID=UPI001B4C4EF5|nr:DUF4845 domain-containing protein [Comamonadaceae bacterium]MBK9988709.1 DUF4845 domain-containing protein [Betaproteobacteria bacterium]MBP9785831.1 DUF4845 domain-containing protein [Giesbergeria sp.]HOF31014.1 DUF4845 domain-containing protein [Burkholderiaceae bacterium]MBK6556838.1 DUF4845 domain-containing protein [Comamonadaceae bacterium]
MAQAFRTRSGQRGISFLGLLFVGTIVACVMVVGAQIFPTVVEYQAVVKAVNKASAGSTVPEVRLIFEKAAAIDDITSIKPKELEVTKENDKVVVSFAYDKEIHLVGPGYLVLKYRGRSR